MFPIGVPEKYILYCYYCSNVFPHIFTSFSINLTINDHKGLNIQSRQVAEDYPSISLQKRSATNHQPLPVFTITTGKSYCYLPTKCLGVTVGPVESISTVFPLFSHLIDTQSLPGSIPHCLLPSVCSQSLFLSSFLKDIDIPLCLIIIIIVVVLVVVVVVVVVVRRRHHQSYPSPLVLVEA